MKIESIQISTMMPQVLESQAMTNQGFLELLASLLNSKESIAELQTPDLEIQDLEEVVELDLETGDLDFPEVEPDLELEVKSEGETKQKHDLDFNLAIFHPMLFVAQKQKEPHGQIPNLDEYDLDLSKNTIDLKENLSVFDMGNGNHEIKSEISSDKVIFGKESLDKESFNNENNNIPIESKKIPVEVTDKEELPNLDIKSPLKEKTETVNEKLEPIKDVKEAKVEDPTPKDFKTIETSLREDLKLQEKPIDSLKANDNIQRLNDSIIKLMQTTRLDNKSVMKLKLFPEELGSLDLTLEVIEGKLVARILVDNESVKQLFTGKLNELNQNLIKQDIIIQDFKVEVKPDPSLNFSFGGEFNQNKNPKNYKNTRILNLEDIPEDLVEKILKNTSDKISILA